MRKEKNKVDAPEAPVEEVEAAESATPTPEAPVEAPKAEAKPAPAKVRNLSVEKRIKHYRQACSYEKSKYSEYDTQPGGVLKRDHKGNVVIQDGVPVLDNRRITKHAAVDMHYNALISELEKTGKL